jgi:hypothetical protein
MRHGWAVFRTLIVLGVGLGGFTPHARGSDLGDDRLGMRTVPIVLLTRSDVQKDLKLDTRQIAACRQAMVALYDRAALLKGRKDAGAQAARHSIDQAMSQWLDQYLTPEQLGRLEQIDLQWEGASAMLSRPFLDESLRLSEEQKKKIRQCIAEGNAQRAREGWSYENHSNQTRKAIAVLDLRQRSIWIKLLGPACEFKIAVEPQTAQNRPAAARR